MNLNKGSNMQLTTPPIWVISDTHFFHKNIINYCQRPWDHVHEMNEGLIERWNESVKDGELVILAGDVALAPSSLRQELKGILQRLNGRKILVKGNHDGPADFYLDSGFESVTDHVVIDKVLITHYPPVGDENGCRKTLNLIKQYDSDFVVHGHQHSEHGGGYLFNVCVDINDWRPVSWETILQRRDLHRGLGLIPAWKSGFCQDLA